jgi:hypothetical protein
MRPKIPDTTKWEVQEKWMLGYPRNAIAAECGLSNGGVTSIIDDWRSATGLELADLIRTIGVTLRKLGMTPAQCVTGLRIHNLIGRVGMDENSIQSFLSDVYGKCQELGINSNHITKYIYELSSLLEDRKNTDEAVSIQDIDAILGRKKQLKTELEHETKRLESGVQKILVEAALCQRDLDKLDQQKTKLEAELSWNWSLREELMNQGLMADDVSRLVDAARFFKDNKFSLQELLIKFSSLKGMENAVQGYEQRLEFLKQQCRSLEQTTQVQDELLAERKFKNRELDRLKELGFGLWDLKLLRNLVTELAHENDQEDVKDNAAVVKKFISDIENHYDEYLHLRKKVGQLKADEETYRALMATMGPLGPAVSSFLHRKPTKDDIREVIKVIKGYYPRTNFEPNASFSSSPSSSTSSPENVNSYQVHERSEPKTDKEDPVSVHADSNQTERRKVPSTFSEQSGRVEKKKEGEIRKEDYPETDAEEVGKLFVSGKGEMACQVGAGEDSNIIKGNRNPHFNTSPESQRRYPRPPSTKKLCEKFKVSKTGVQNQDLCLTDGTKRNHSDDGVNQKKCDSVQRISYKTEQTEFVRDAVFDKTDEVPRRTHGAEIDYLTNEGVNMWDNNWQAGQAEMNWSITRLVYESITKPLLSQYRELGYDFNLDLD